MTDSTDTVAPTEVSPNATGANGGGSSRGGGLSALKLAELQQMASGMGIKGDPWTLAEQRPVIDNCIEAFGPSRCLFA